MMKRRFEDKVAIVTGACIASSIDGGVFFNFGLDPVFVQRVIDAGLVGSERATALQNQNGLSIFLWLRFSKPRHTR